MATYSRTSPYYNTSQFGKFLDVLDVRTIPAADDDVLYQIDSFYDNRPDLLAFDLYGKAELWWVFAARNPNTLKDPLFDFAVGTTIYIPNGVKLKQELGIT
jgi:hypothetical protein